MQTKNLLRGGALALLLVITAYTLAGVAQTTISSFQKVRVTSTAADALSVSGGISGAVGGNVPIKNQPDTISGGWTHTSPLTISSTVPVQWWRETDGPADAKTWRLAIEGGQLFLQAWNDAGTSLADVLSITRSGIAFTNFGVSANAISFGGNTTVTGSLSSTGAYSSSSNIGAAGNIQAGAQFFAANGSASAPGYSFLSYNNTGFFTNGSAIGWTVGGAGGGSFNSRGLFAGGGVYGTGGQSGGTAIIGSNTSGAGASGCLGLQGRSSQVGYFYIASDYLLRYNIDTDGCPTENNAGPHNGSVVGDQSSRASEKVIYEEVRDFERSLGLFLQTPIYRFRYKDGRYRDIFTGVVLDHAPADFGKDSGRSLNEISLHGHTIGAIRALKERSDALEARLAALEQRRP